MGYLTLTAERIHPLSVAFERVNPLAVSISVERVEPLSVSASLVCTTNKKNYYLRVAPKELQWVSEWDSALFDVESNTTWKTK